tara:strand:- start:125075 stop:125587 length:513 start_codon:yes stop_codon:yes gene_type:complete
MMNITHKINDNKLSFVIITDTHSHLDEQIRNLINKKSYVIHAGDIGDINIISDLKSQCKNIFAVNGNNDNYSELLDIEKIETQYGMIVVEHGDKHGMDYHESLRKSYPDAFCIIYGHTHKHIFDMREKPYVINPGASGSTRTNGGASCVLLEIDESGSMSFELKKFDALS